MSKPVTITITADADTIEGWLRRLVPQPDAKSEPFGKLSWKKPKPWFGELTPEEAADLEVGTYGKGKGKRKSRPRQ